MKRESKITGLNLLITQENISIEKIYTGIEGFCSLEPFAERSEAKMICQVCGEREAAFHFKEMINGEVKELHVCEICAKEKGLSETFFMPSFSLSNLMAGLTELEVPLSEEISVSCPHCGLSYEDIKKKGKIGCGLCYEALKEYLTPLLERIQGKVRHSGKIPRKGKVEDQRERQIYELRKQLEEVVRKEEYERAAELRDEIRRWEKEK